MRSASAIEVAMGFSQKIPRTPLSATTGASSA